MPSSSSRNGIKKPVNEKENNRILMDDVAEGKELHPIPVINNTNNKIPQPFTYINFNVTSCETRTLLGETILKDGCSCENGCDSNCDCENNSIIGFDPDARVVSNPVSYDYYNDYYVECGAHCGCFGKCKRQIFPKNKALKKLEVRYMDGKNFGVVAAQPIAAGMPIAEYIGEIFVGGIEDDIFPTSHYQQDLLIDNDHNKFIIDARRMGNISRLINHSCFNNVLQICVYPSIPNLKRSSPLPKVALVAFRDILPGQELCFDYRAMYFLDRNIPCLCYEPNCHVPPYDHVEKAKSIKDQKNELNENKKQMMNLFSEARDLEHEVLEID
uniref:SET domain-containing protein n=1 Tax=Panagrolaimus sp. ES5 TaxID=591445 RepID=A0AC34GSP0_9BILA